MTIKRAIFLLAGIAVLIVLVGTAVLYSRLRSMPEFYSELLEQTEALTPKERREAADEFEQRSAHLVESVREQPTWSEEFTQRQINSFLMEAVAGKVPGGRKDLVPKKVKAPRVLLSEGRVQCGFQYEHPKVSGVISFEVEPTLRGPRTLALRVNSLMAGEVEIPVDEVLDEIVEKIRKKKGWTMSIERTGDVPVIVIEVTSKSKKTPELQSLVVSDGKLTVTGETKSEAGSEEAETEPPTEAVPEG